MTTFRLAFRPALVLVAALILSTPASASAPIQIRHAEPGCHWFYAGGHKTKSLTVRGYAVVANLDIAAQIVSSTAPTRRTPVRIPVGKSAKFGPGVYQIRMAGQEMMDNVLRLVVTK